MRIVLPLFLLSLRYDRGRLRRDLVAGLTVATVAVPQAMAYALLAGVSPVYGLYTAIVMTALGSLFGSSPHLINGPTNAISLVVFGIVAGVGAGPDDPTRLALVALLAVLAGLIQIALAVLRLGGLARHIPETVVLGFMAGGGLLVALTQIPTVLGLRPAGTGQDHLLYRLWLTCSQGDCPDVWAVIISLGTVALIGGLHWLNRRFKMKVPEMLVTLVLVAAFVGLFGLAPGGEAGRLHIAGGFPTPRWPALPADWIDQLRPIGGGALAIALLGLVEALAMARALAALSGLPFDNNRQVLAEGLANVGGGLFGCLPGSGSLSRSAINYYAGAATRLSGVISAAGVAAALLLFAPAARFIPQAALAGVLLWTAWRIIDPRRLWAGLRSSPAAAVVILATALASILVNIQLAVLAGVTSSVVFGALRGHVRTNPPRSSGKTGRLLAARPAHGYSPDYALN
jgi:SulP family sulfate permease